MTATVSPPHAGGLDVDVAVCSVAHPVSVREMTRTLSLVVKDVHNDYRYKADLGNIVPHLTANIVALASPTKRLHLAAQHKNINDLLLQLIDVLWELTLDRISANSLLTGRDRKKIARQLTQITAELEIFLLRPHVSKKALKEAADLLSRQPVFINIHGHLYDQMVQHATGITNLRTVPERGSEPAEDGVPGWPLWVEESREKLAEKLCEVITKAFENPQHCSYFGLRQTGLLDAARMTGDEASADSLVFWNEEITEAWRSILDILARYTSAEPGTVAGWTEDSNMLSVCVQRIKNRLGGRASLTGSAADPKNVIAVRTSGVMNLLWSRYPVLQLDLTKYDDAFTSRTAKKPEQLALEMKDTPSPGATGLGNNSSPAVLTPREQWKQIKLEKLCSQFSPTLYSAYLKTETLITAVEKSNPSPEEWKFLTEIKDEHYPAIVESLQSTSPLITDETQLRVFADEAESQFTLLQEALQRIIDRSLRQMLEDMQEQTASLRKKLERDYP